MYDIIYIGKNTDQQYKNLKTLYPTAKFAEDVSSAKKKCFTKMFWVVWPDINVCDNFKFDYSADEWSQEYIHAFLNGDTYDGIILVPKRAQIAERELRHRFFVNKKEVDIVASTPKPFDVFYVDTWEDYEHALENSSTEMFWAVSHNLKYSMSYINSFYFSHHNSYDRKENHAFVHDVDERKLYNGVFLCSRNKPLNKKQIDYRFLVNAKQWDDVVSGSRNYEIYVINNYREYLDVMEHCPTEMFWMIPPHVSVRDNFEFDLYFSHDNEYDRKINHVFKNGDYYDGVVLCSKHAPISEREFKYRFITNKKEHEVVASDPLKYDKIVVNTYEEFCELQKTVSTDFFYVIPSDVDVDWNFDYQVPYYERDNIHVFKNGEYYDGVFLIHKENLLAQREFDYRFFRNKKEIDIVASTPKPYDKIYVDNYDDLIMQLSTVKSNFVWIIPNDVDVDWNFDYQVPYYERDNIHVFKNGKFHDGVFLIHKDKSLAQREFDYRFFRNKKEIDIVASTPKAYDKIYVNNYDDLIMQLSTVKSNFVWIIPNDVDVNWDFHYQIPYYERDNIHVFKNGKYHDGVFLIHKDKPLAQREFDYRFFVNKKEIDITVSTPKLYDIVFISYNEPNADDNYTMLTQRFPRAKRIHGVKGIHQAHIEAARLCDTNMFWVVDGDAHVLDDFTFAHQVPKWQRDQVFVWRSRNPINDLEYGYGGIKLFPVKETLNMDITKTDMTTSISSKFNAMRSVSNITSFNTDEFSTWKSAFRECCKLASKTIRGQVDNETDERLEQWCETGQDALYGKYAIQGACAGRAFGYDNRNSPDILNLINDFDWLYEQFSKHTI